MKKIISNVTGYVAPGQAMFIMGASGAGKSTLLNILSDRVNTGSGFNLSGDILINDTVKMNRSNFGLYSKYVM